MPVLEKLVAVCDNECVEGHDGNSWARRVEYEAEVKHRGAHDSQGGIEHDHPLPDGWLWRQTTGWRLWSLLCPVCVKADDERVERDKTLRPVGGPR